MSLILGCVGVFVFSALFCLLLLGLSQSDGWTGERAMLLTSTVLRRSPAAADEGHAGYSDVIWVLLDAGWIGAATSVFACVRVGSSCGMMIRRHIRRRQLDVRVVTMLRMTWWTIFAVAAACLLGSWRAA